MQTVGAKEAMLPLLASPDLDAPIAWSTDGPIGRPAFARDVLRLAANLPDRRYALNLCEDRYAFLVAFAAAAARRQTSLLPSSRINAAIEETCAQFADSYVLDDARVAAVLHATATIHRREQELPLLSADHVMAIAFTSGSTGHAQAHAKRWGELVVGAHLAYQRFGFALGPGTTVLATVPAQHMYGIETSIMLPLTGPVAMQSGRPLLPEEVRAALVAVPAPRVLVTTPAHLRVIVGARGEWPALALVISATAPLSATLAAAVETALAAPVMEIYGCTEAGSIASRRTVLDEDWTPYDGFTVANGAIRAAHLPAPVPLNDMVEARADGRFALGGRQQDLVNIAGKRNSLAYLNRVLIDIPGIEDGAFVAPEDVGDRPMRLAALVVAPTLTPSAIRAALAQRIDPLFLPRPLLRVDRLPRNAVGKLSRGALLAALEQARRRRGGGDG